MKPTALASWIVAMNCAAKNQGGKADFNLASSVASEGQERLDVIASWRGEQSQPAEIAAEALDAAREDAKVTGGDQRYVLVAVCGREILGRRDWTVKHGGASSELVLQPHEQPSAMGLLSLFMRQAERKDLAFLQQGNDLVASVKVVAEVQNNAILRLEAENERLRARETETILAREDAVSKQHERRLALLDAERSAEIQNRALAALVPLIPAIAHRILGGPQANAQPRAQSKPSSKAGGDTSPKREPTGSDAAIDAAVDRLFATISLEQVEQLGRIFTDEQFVLLNEIRLESEARQAAKAESGGPSCQAA